MPHLCDGGKWSEDEVLDKRLRKHDTTRWTNGETYQSPVRDPSCENLLIVSRLISKGAKIGGTQDKMLIKKNGVSMTVNASKVQKTSVMFYLMAKRYAQEGQESLTNLPENKMETSE